MLKEKCHDCSVETRGKSRDSWDNDISFPFLDQGTGGLDECFYKVQKIAFFSSAEYWCWKSVGLLAFGFSFPILSIVRFPERCISGRITWASFEETVLAFFFFFLIIIMHVTILKFISVCFYFIPTQKSVTEVTVSVWCSQLGILFWTLRIM